MNLNILLNCLACKQDFLNDYNINMLLPHDSPIISAIQPWSGVIIYYDVADLTNVIHTNMIASTMKQITKRLDNKFTVITCRPKKLNLL